MAVPSVMGAASVSAQGQAMIRTAVATCADIRASGHQASAPAAARASAPTTNQNPNAAVTPVSQSVFGLANTGLSHSSASRLCETSRAIASRSVPADHAAAGAARVSARDQRGRALPR